ncbi:MAG TPA: glycosyltransferase family 39 protein [Gemmata sp.]|nr:glycosyltransferase family 39 protein [Gemmata sp.]
MSAEVGGLMVAVPPHRSLFGPDYLRLFALLVVGIAIHGWLVVHTAVPARDSLGYARIALNLSYPSAGSQGEPRQRIDVIRTAEQPPGYPLAVWVTEKALRSIVDLPLPDRSLLAAQVANAIAAVLLVVPLYLIGRILFGRNVGFGAALLFQVLPVPARMTSDGLSEGVYLLVVATAILFAVRSVRQPGVGGFLLCGMATGASYLVRPEGLGVAIAVGAVIAWSWVSRRWPRDQALGWLIALLVGVALVGLPYMMLIGKLTNKPTGNYIINPLDSQPAAIWRGQPEARGVGHPTVSMPLFAKWWDPVVDAGKNRELWAVEAVWSELIKSLHYVIGALAAFALIAHRRQLLSPDLGMWFLIVLGTLNAALMVYLADRIGYVSERHTLQFVMLSCVFASAALEPLANLLGSLPKLGRLIVWPKAAPCGLLFGIVLSALPFTLQTMHAQREGHKYAGRWLASQMADDDWLIDPLAWAEWYAGRTLYKTTSYQGQPKVKWVVVEEGKEGNISPHSRLPQWELANELKTKGKLVYKWPESPKSKSSPVICVYRLQIEEPKPLPPIPQPDHTTAPPPREVPSGGGQ